MAKGFLLDEESIRKLQQLVNRHSVQIQNLQSPRRRTRRSRGGGDIGFDRCRARATQDFFGNTSSLVVDNVVATKGDKPTQQKTDPLTVFNYQNLAGKNGDEVLIEYRDGDQEWVIYQVTNVLSTVVADVQFVSPRFEKKDLEVWIPYTGAAPSWNVWHTGDTCE